MKNILIALTLSLLVAGTVSAQENQESEKKPVNGSCSVHVNGSGGPIVPVEIKQDGSSLTGDFTLELKSNFATRYSVRADITQVGEELYSSVLNLTDNDLGVTSLNQDFIHMPISSTDTTSTLWYSKGKSPEIILNGKKISVNIIQLICNLKR